jgi:broad specificity phosphatase PhoE
MAVTEFKDLPEVRAKLKPTVIFVRHGSTRFDGEGVKNLVQGWLPGGLDKRGVAEAQAIGRTLGDMPIRALYTSDLDRALDTAEVICSHQKSLKPKTLKMLRCWNMGILGGETKTLELKKVIDIFQNVWTKRVISKGESFDQFKSRFLPAMKALLEASKEKPEEGFIVVVVHSDTLRIIHAWVKAGCYESKLDPELLSEAIRMVHVKPGEAAVLTPHREGYKISYLKGKP